MLKLRMRTKFLLSMLLISAGLTCTSLLLVRHSVQKQVRREIFADLRNSVSTFQNFQRERELTLTHSAELLADLPNLRALMTTEHEATIQDASSGLWQLAGSDLFLLADRSRPRRGAAHGVARLDPRDGAKVAGLQPSATRVRDSGGLAVNISTKFFCGQYISARPRRTGCWVFWSSATKLTTVSPRRWEGLRPARWRFITAMP